MIEPVSGRIRVWDLPVRIFHWSLVACFATAWLSSDDAEALHQWAGYLALGLVAIRTLWGFVGSRHARFSDFVPSPTDFCEYAGQALRGNEPRYLGHNPAAAVMILFLLSMIIFIGFSGWLMTTDMGWGNDTLEEIHELAAELALTAVVVHVAAAIYESVHQRENLVRAMIDGYKRAP